MIEENVTSGRPSQIVEAEQTLKVLTAELQKYKEFSNRWRIEFNVQLEELNGEYGLLIVGKTGEHGSRLTMTAAEVAHYSEDPESGARNIADTMLKQILTEVVREELVPKILKGIANVNALSKSAL